LIDWIMTLPDDLTEAFRNEVYQYEAENKMEYVTSIERLGIAKGRKLMKKVETLQDITELQRFMKFSKKAATLGKANEYFNDSCHHG